MNMGFDLDDSLANSTGPYLKDYNPRYGQNFRLEDLTTPHFWQIFGITREEANARYLLFNDLEAKRDILPMTGAKEAITQLSVHHQLHVITARPVKIAASTHEWLSQHFWQVFSGVHFCTTENGYQPKHEVCQQLGITILIDDHPETAELCATAGIQVYLFDQPWNQSVPNQDLLIRVHSWTHILQRLT